MTSTGLANLVSASKAKPYLCLEVNPPRGVDLGPTFELLDNNTAGIDFFNVTDSALARMKLAPLPFASMLKDRYGIEPLVNLACRDRNLIALQGDLLAGWALGVRSIVALTGDAVTIGDSPESKGVFEVNSVGLMQVIRTVNSGHDIVGNQLRGAPQYVVGGVVNPNAKNIGAEIRRLSKKVAAGCCFALSQPVFDLERSRAFFTEARAIGIPILMGLLPLRNGRAAQVIAQIPGIRLSSEIESIAQGDPDRDLRDFSVDYCVKLAEANRDCVAGFHVISGAAPKLALVLTQRLVELIKGIG